MTTGYACDIGNWHYAILEYVDHLGVEHIEALPAKGIPIPLAYATHPKRATQWQITPGAGISAADHPAATVTTPIAARAWVRLLADLAVRSGLLDVDVIAGRAHTAASTAAYSERGERYDHRAD
ncbi:hypothetical protein QDT91_29550 (plasmid) [Mycolicibacterium aubagnense]|uniref:hypothetical protein n=1 Tax=Mycolicibacterium aubagnense TaxID=319707 RepID=UPI00244DDAC4|nr:hypothetical protein [Mycolicibacterium aubagnense]WGI36164.1 hypothetical protein QDT91_29550 [Mycolicibacterium aubagnense]